MLTKFVRFCPATVAPQVACLTAFVLLASCVGQVGTGDGRATSASGGAKGTVSGGAEGTAGAAKGRCEAAPPLPPRIRKLSDGELQQVVSGAIPGISWQPGAFGDSKAGGTSFTTLSTRQDLSQLVLSSALTQAKLFAALAYTDLQKSQTCLAAATPTVDCVGKALGVFADRIQHGQASADDTAAATTAYSGALAGSDSASAMKIVLASLILSPKTLFRFELGATTDKRLSAVELAQELSFFLTGKGPDAELLAQVNDGSLLATPGAYDAQVDRLLNTDAAAAQFSSFVDELLHFKQLPAKLRPGSALTPEIAADMVAETEAFLRYTYFTGASLKEMFTAKATPVSKALASYYGIPYTRMGTKTPYLPAGFDFVPVEANKRAGLLDQGSVLVALTRGGEMDPVARGHVLAARLFCVTLGSPPAAVVASNTPFMNGMTPRDRLEVHLKDPSCASCHAVMDPPGLAFEGFDSQGRSRVMIPTYGGGAPKPVDATGTLNFLSGGPVSFNNSVEFSAIVAQAPEVKQCFAQSLARYALGTDSFEEGSCEIEALLKGATAKGSDLSLKQVMGGIARLDLFKVRR